MKSSKLTGAWGEALAAEYLKKKHYKLVGAGYRCRFGEIDLIARKKDLIVFVEVKLRRDGKFAQAYEAVTAVKQRRIIATALQWMAAKKDTRQMRFDVIEVYTDSDRLNHIEDAFQA